MDGWDGNGFELEQVRATFQDLASLVQKLDSAIHPINFYPLDNAIGFRNTCPLDSDLSSG